MLVGNYRDVPTDKATFPRNKFYIGRPTSIRSIRPSRTGGKGGIRPGRPQKKKGGGKGGRTAARRGKAGGNYYCLICSYIYIIICLYDYIFI
jgi:hypothetical protein